MTKEYNKKYKEYLKKLLSTCLKIEEQGIFLAWYNLSPHVSNISIHVTEAKNTDIWIFRKDVYYNAEWKTEAEMEKDLKNLLSELKKYLKN